MRRFAIIMDDHQRFDQRNAARHARRRQRQDHQWIAPFLRSVRRQAGEPNVRTGEFRDIAVTLRNARCLAEEPSLDREGFALGRFETRVSDFYDEDQVADI